MNEVQIQGATDYQRHALTIVSPKLLAILDPTLKKTFKSENDATNYENWSYKDKLVSSFASEKSTKGAWSLDESAVERFQRLDGHPTKVSVEHPLRDRDCREAVLSFEKDALKRTAMEAGLWLWIDELDRSHKSSQSREGDRTCDAWHAVMHRREGDFGNAKYWVRRVGEHSSHAGLFQSLTLLERTSLSSLQQRVYDKLTKAGAWRGEAMVDLCAEIGASQDGEEGLLLRAIQQLEMLHLFASTSGERWSLFVTSHAIEPIRISQAELISEG